MRAVLSAILDCLLFCVVPASAMNALICGFSSVTSERNSKTILQTQPICSLTATLGTAFANHRLGGSILSPLTLPFCQKAPNVCGNVILVYDHSYISDRNPAGLVD